MLRPCDDPNLPSYESDTYKILKPLWSLAADVFNGVETWFVPGENDVSRMAKYLPQESEEPIDSYRVRLTRSFYQFDDRYRRAVLGFAAFLSDVHTSEDVVGSMVDQVDNIDRMGNSLNGFVKKSNETVFNKGAVFWLVEKAPMPVDDEGNSLVRDALDEQRFNNSPYLVAIDPENVLNWRFMVENGKHILTQLTIREFLEVDTGEYGTQTEERYRVLTPGRYDLYQIVDTVQGTSLVHLPEFSGYTLGFDGDPLPIIPIVYYAATDAAGFEAKPPLLNLARLNIHLFQLESDRANVMHLCNLPTWALADDAAIDPITGSAYNEKSLVLGPNNVVKHSPSGKLYVGRHLI